MSEPTTLALTALGLPLIAAVIAALLAAFPKASRLAGGVAVLAFGAAAAYAFLALLQVHSASGAKASFVSERATWFAAGNFDVGFVIHLDPLSAVMLATVTFVATWIALFSTWYMKGDAGYARYFAVMSLFVFAMCLLVLANDFLLLIAGWEGVGVCSYLLIGYFYAKPSAANAARKAFLVTRLGDVGMIIGIFLLWQAGGFHTDLTGLFEYIRTHPSTHPTMTAACLLLFCGAVGKSAQLPLYVWLPDAMEGPTPVSALIHAATMVTAGVYLLARCAPLFVLTADAQIVVCLTGGLTALLAAFLALAQNDLKRVLAYSTVSQLGFMFMALGTGGAVEPNLAVTAAVFHLFTHAFFKALLFLGSGSVMHAMGDVIDMRRFGGLRSLLPITHGTFLAGAAALAGLPLLSGFWSKDQILDVLYEASEHGNKHAAAYWFVGIIAITTAFLTAFYTFRAYFLTFWGETKTPPEAHVHAPGPNHADHDSAEHGGHHGSPEPLVMVVPLVVLALGAVFVGAIVEPLTGAFSGFLARSISVPPVSPEHAHPHFNWLIGAIGTAVALGGVGLAWAMYRKGGPEEVPTALRGVWHLSRNKLYVDEIYTTVFVKPAEMLATTGRQIDVLLDMVARLVSYMPRFAAAALRPLQNGLVQFYALGMVLGLAAFLAVVLVRSAQ